MTILDAAVATGVARHAPDRARLTRREGTVAVRGGLEALRVLARERGGERLFEGRLTAASVVRWRCAQGHVW